MKTGNLIPNWVPLNFSYNHLVPEKLSSQSILLNSLVNWEQFGSTTYAYVKKTVFHLFTLNWEVQSEQHSKILKSLHELGKTWTYSLRLTLKYPNSESTDELGEVRS